MIRKGVFFGKTMDSVGRIHNLAEKFKRQLYKTFKNSIRCQFTCALFAVHDTVTAIVETF